MFIAYCKIGVSAHSSEDICWHGKLRTLQWPIQIFPALTARFFQTFERILFTACAQADQQGGVASAQEAARTEEIDHRQAQTSQRPRCSIKVLFLNYGKH